MKVIPMESGYFRNAAIECLHSVKVSCRSIIHGSLFALVVTGQATSPPPPKGNFSRHWSLTEKKRVTGAGSRGNCRLPDSVADPGCLYRIPDPNFFHPPIRIFSIPDPGSRIRIKEFKYYNPRIWFLRSRKYDPGIPDPDPDLLSIPEGGMAGGG
jgi:hypothetical protein